MQSINVEFISNHYFQQHNYTLFKQLKFSPHVSSFFFLRPQSLLHRLYESCFFLLIEYSVQRCHVTLKQAISTESPECELTANLCVITVADNDDGVHDKFISSFIVWHNMRFAFHNLTTASLWFDFMSTRKTGILFFPVHSFQQRSNQNQAKMNTSLKCHLIFQLNYDFSFSHCLPLKFIFSIYLVTALHTTESNVMLTQRNSQDRERCAIKSALNAAHACNA